MLQDVVKYLIMTRELSVYINDQLYKTFVVESTPEGGYDPRYVLEQIAIDHNAGLLDPYLIDGQKHVIRISEMRKVI